MREGKECIEEREGDGKGRQGSTARGQQKKRCILFALHHRRSELSCSVNVKVFSSFSPSDVMSIEEC